MPLTTLAASNLLNLAFGGTTWPGGQPAILYMALFTATPSVSGGGTEVTGGSYARVAVTADATNFPAITVPGTAMTNGTVITFPISTAAWGTITHMGIFDAPAGGNLLFFAPLASTLTPAVGNLLTWAVNDLSFDSTGGLGTYLQMMFLNYLFNQAAFPTIANHFLTLGTGASEAGITGEITSARKQVPNTTGNWPITTNALKTLTNDFSFVAMTNGTWSYLGIYNSSSLSSVTLSAGATTTSSTTVTVTSTASIVAGMLVSGTGIPAGAYVASVTDATHFVLSVPATATNTGLTLTAVASMLAFVPLASAITTAGGADTPLVASGAVTLALN